MDKKIIVILAKLLGFTKRGDSELGKFLRRISHPNLKHHLCSGLIIFSSFIIYAYTQAQNVGGSSLLNFDSLKQPKISIDAQTLKSIQTPIKYSYESRGFSFFHAGADLVADIGTPVFPIMPGVVKSVASESTGYGYHVIVTHDQGIEAIYAHLSKIEVETGHRVTANTEIGLSGNTGNSTGPHLHLEIRQNGNLINPAEIVPDVN